MSPKQVCHPKFPKSFQFQTLNPSKTLGLRKLIEKTRLGHKQFKARKTKKLYINIYYTDGATHNNDLREFFASLRTEIIEEKKLRKREKGLYENQIEREGFYVGRYNFDSGKCIF